MEKEIVNRVATSPLISLDLETFYQAGDRKLIDLKDILFQGLILREKDLRDFIKTLDLTSFKESYVAITCTADAVIPTWAYMLLTAALQPVAKKIFFGNLIDLEAQLFIEQLQRVDWPAYKGAKVVIKGCSKVEVPVSAYVFATGQLRAVAASIMFGEPCSTVPIYKSKLSPDK